MRLALVASVLALAACSKDAPRGITAEPASPAPPTVASAAPAVVPAALRLGEPISALPASLADLAGHPRDFTGKAFTTTGVVTAVCQEMGCWMEIKDDTGQAHIRMHGHAFFVPKTAPGHHARVQGTLVPSTDKTECDDEAPSSATPAQRSAKIELDATGVELD